MPSRNTTSRSMPTRSSQPEQQQIQGGRLDGMRSGIQQLFSGRSILAPRPGTPESPKSPVERLRLSALPSPRFVLPYLPQTPSPSPTGSLPVYTSRPGPVPRTPPPTSSRPVTLGALRHAQQSSVSSIPRQVVHNPSRRINAVDPAEQHLVDLTSRRGRRKKVQPKERGCGAKVKNRKTRGKIISSFMSGLFLTLVLTICKYFPMSWLELLLICVDLALALTDRNLPQQFHALMVMIILGTTIFFCYSLVCLTILIIHPPADDALDQERLASTVRGPGGYANPPRPIRVALVRDEEAAGIESEVTKLPPPAYGLWRESVVS